MNERVVLTSAEIRRSIDDLSKKICADIVDINKFAIVAVQTGGVEIARRLRENIEKAMGQHVKNGIIDITFHRDDIATRGMLPVIKETRIGFDITDMTILLVDDVIFTGRSVKAALETLTTFGRPKMIKLFVLIDRGNRELPIQPEYCGHVLKTGIKDNVQVQLSEQKSEDDKVIHSGE